MPNYPIATSDLNWGPARTLPTLAHEVFFRVIERVRLTKLITHGRDDVSTADDSLLTKESVRFSSRQMTVGSAVLRYDGSEKRIH